MSEKAVANSSPCSWPLTVRPVFSPKKSCSQSIAPLSVCGGPAGGRVVTRNISPAPSQSLAVMIGVWTCRKPRS